ncbi:MAG: hypothetical protein ACON45_03310 [Paracoccaceae bacterium]
MADIGWVHRFDPPDLYASDFPVSAGSLWRIGLWQWPDPSIVSGGVR